MPTRALVVDDDAGVCGLIQGVLVGAGIDALVLTGSEGAEEHLGREKFAVALFDLLMPPPDGLELARHARKLGINRMTPIILMSDDQSTSATAQGFAAGASFFLYKPIDKTRLLALVRATQGVIEQERRRFRRVPLQARVRIGFDREEWDCETIDVSLNGMLVQAPVSLPPGSSVRIGLYLAPHAKPILGRGAVVRLLSGNRMGIQLNYLNVAESARLQDFLLPIILREGETANAVHS
ncbi:MAG TPA: PilZ domain-containing protein [Candidatus Acidoferrales bacterium]|nr:PilZ domain-containing protein [Candidatus Acidoferrales bacterium]